VEDVLLVVDDRAEGAGARVRLARVDVAWRCTTVIVSAPAPNAAGASVKRVSTATASAIPAGLMLMLSPFVFPRRYGCE